MLALIPKINITGKIKGEYPQAEKISIANLSFDTNCEFQRNNQSIKIR